MEPPVGTLAPPRRGVPAAHGTATDPAPAGRSSRRDPRRIAGLDGLRAIAITAVLLFHLDPRWLPGGFLGVDVFFVVSGFLITTLLVREHATTGTVDLGSFWTRRARRLLPALAVMVPFAVLLARLTEGDLLVGIGRQVVGAATFTSNWLEIAAGSDYFAAASPVLLAPLWSLAVEEQFYLLWPIAVILLLRLVHHPRGRILVTVGLAAASAVLMALLLDPAHPTRVYYGTDTHLMGLMTGAALAFAWTAPYRAGTLTPTWERHRRTVLGGSAALLLVLFVTLDETSGLTFRGGILLASVATAALLLAVVDRPGRARALLEVPVVRWLGARSYGIYVWHWPIVLVVGQDLPVQPGGTAYLLTRLWCLVVTLVVADLSYRFVEMPVRRLGFAGAGAELARRLRGLGARRARVVWGVATTLTLALVVVLLTAPDRTSTEELLRANEAQLAADAAAEPAAATGTSASTGTTTTTAVSDAPGDWSMPRGREIDAFGDSMLVGSVHAMEYYFPGIRMDARSNRRWSEAPALVRARGDSLRRAVVLAFGTNAGTDTRAIARVLDELGPERMVVVVTLHGPFTRIESDNAALHRLLDGRDNVALADWDAALSGTSDMLQSDGIHPSLRGAHLYSSTVRAAFAELSERHTGERVRLKDLPMP
jgi:peptidoglycan/LPS O-acetylase OafA/YrhL